MTHWPRLFGPVPLTKTLACSSPSRTVERRHRQAARSDIQSLSACGVRVRVPTPTRFA